MTTCLMLVPVMIYFFILGLNEFSGSKFPELFAPKHITIDDENRAAKSNTFEDSDSDSDYEYFKVHNELNTKDKVVEMDDEDNIAGPSKTLSTFEEALKSAVTEDELMLPATVNQTFLVIPMKLRLVTLCALIVEHCVLNKKGGKMIVFMATLEMVDYHADLIEAVLTGEETKTNNKKSKTKKKEEASDGSDSEFEVDYGVSEGGLVPVDIEMFKLHGSMPHEQRMEVFKQFRAARAGVLICTVSNFLLYFIFLINFYQVFQDNTNTKHLHFHVNYRIVLL